LELVKICKLCGRTFYVNSNYYFKRREYCGKKCSSSINGSKGRGIRKKYNTVVKINKDITEIKFTNSDETFIIDTKNLEKVLQKTWYKFKMGYAASNNRADGVVFLHSFIMRLHNKNGMVDHRDHNVKNNKEENLRICNYSGNNRNCIMPKNNTTGFKGVRKLGNNKYSAFIKVNYVQKYLGAFNDKKSAAIAYNKAAEKYFGEFAYLNEIN